MPDIEHPEPIDPSRPPLSQPLGPPGNDPGGSQPRRILIVDDEDANLRVLERILRSAGFTDIHAESDPRRALPAFRSFEPDLLLLDLNMPHLDGFSVMQQIRSRVPEGHYFPILVITGETSPDVKRSALAHGARDFLTKPFDRTEVVLRVRNLLETRALTLRLEAQLRQRTGELHHAELAVAERLALAAELRDYGGGEHAQRVGRTAARTGSLLGMSTEDTLLLRAAAPLHDIGKIGIPDAVLLKNGPLTLEEFDLVKTHTTLGARILSGSESAVLQMGEEIALYHHENWDGTGYTPGLAGEAIPLVARIVAVADVFDALTHDRPYKAAWSHDDAVQWIESERGKKFDPAVVDSFLRVQATEGLPAIEDSGDWDDVDRAYSRFGPRAGGES